MSAVSPTPPFRVLFLCTGNSARSILCEATLRHLGGTRFVAYSAGSRPAGRVHPQALAQLQVRGIATEGLTSKSWDAFSGAGAPELDVVITVCDSAAQESCPVFFGDFARAHWSLSDPSQATGDAATLSAAFARTHALVTARIRALVALPLDTMEPAQRAAAVNAIADAFPAETVEPA